MTYQRVILGTPPAGTDGDTVRGAMDKLNAIIDGVNSTSAAFQLGTRPVFGTATPWDNQNLPNPAQTGSSPSFTGITVAAASGNTGVELGGTSGVAASSFVDFHSSGNNTDYDARIIASGGNTAVGQGTLTFTALNVAFSSRPLFGTQTPWDTGNLPSPAQTTGATFTGPVSVPNRSAQDNSANVANTAYVDASMSAGPGSSAFSWRNRIINGCCRVQQRAQVSVGTGNTYSTVDRFFSAIGGGAGGSAVFGANSITIGGISRACIALIATTPPVTLSSGAWWYGFNQIIEGHNSFDLVGKPITVSFWWQSNVTGVFPVSIRDSASSYSFVQTFNYSAANTPQFVTIAVPPIPAGANIPESTAAGLHVSIGSLNSGTYMCPTASLGAWQNANYISAAPAFNWAATANNYIRMTELQVEAGSISTPFERRPVGVEMALCQRYYEIGQQPFLYISSISGGSGAYGDIRFAVTKRANPSITMTGWQYYAAGSPTGFTPALYSSQTNGFMYQGAGLTNWQGWSGVGIWAANSDY